MSIVITISDLQAVPIDNNFNQILPIMSTNSSNPNEVSPIHNPRRMSLEMTGNAVESQFVVLVGVTVAQVSKYTLDYSP